MIFAALGDLHGRMAVAIDTLRQAELAAGIAIDFVLQVGDFEPHRNDDDLSSMYAPHRRKELGEFPAYASGEKRFPWPLYFIGGNHEPYGYLRQGPNGFTVADNVHFLGFAGTRNLSGLEVAFLSGIHDDRYHDECRAAGQIVHTEDTAGQRALSCFTARDVERLQDVKHPHVLLLHEWPLGLVRPEDHEPGEPRHRRLRWGETGVRRLRALVEQVEPAVVLCGHVHRRYRRVIAGSGGTPINVHCMGCADDRGGCALFAFDGMRIEEIQPAPTSPAPLPDQEAVNEVLAQISYPSTHQYTVNAGRVCPAPVALPRLLELESVLPDRRWRSMIDIGCGKAMFLLWAWQRFGLERLVGVDDAPPMVSAARLAAAHLGAPATILQGPPGEFATVLAPADLVVVLHCYHYLFFGSLAGSPGNPSHESWFDFFARITADTLVFANPLELSDDKAHWFLERGARAEAIAWYCPEAILSAARRHFSVTLHPLGGGRPYLVMRHLIRRDVSMARGTPSTNSVGP